ncbi:XrtA system polysaccharide chain length determinant [Rheinheimera sp. UJ63]|uniref:XrtA system polysaccharide chain length determinant n=1 Tax=Rheinheimera sp. UJ63 TaxID=2910157 RepID=UPI001F1D9D75|nr:XrtA system polysaccharide chain length determinant [Rheinheimera sp. UJ63]MCF4007785.1 chain length-determining protein [Rheinheimera sp. UJ63]
MKEIQQALELLNTYLQGVWLRRRYIIITAWLICPAGWLYVYKMPPTYEASARLYVESSTFLEPILRGLTINTNQRDEISLMARTLLSRTNLQKIARQADLDLQSKTDLEFEAIIDALQKEIKVSGTSRENIYSITYANPQPQQALKVVQETLNTFMENRIGNSRADSQAAQEFLDREIADYERRLMEAEQKLSEFKKTRMNLLPGSESNYYSQLANEQQKLEDAKLGLRELETRLQSARGQLTGVNPAGGDNNTITTQYDERIKQLQTQLDMALIRFTENHPDVVETRRLLDSLVKQRNDELTALAESSSGRSGSGFVATQNSVYQELQLNVARLETEVASTRVRVNAFQGKVDELESRLNLIPEIEAQFTGLNRDYDVNRSKYEALLARREASELSRRVDASEQDVQFKIIEPPRVPFEASGPNRRLLYSVVLLLGLGAGLGMAFLRSLVSPVLSRASQLSFICDYPVFGVISHTEKEKILKQVRLHFFYFTALTAMLIVFYLVLMSNDMLFGRSAELLMRVVR